MNIQDLIGHLGKGPGFFAFAALATAIGGVLAYVKPDSLIGYAAVLTPICSGLYGGGAMKAWAESRNGSNGSAPSSPHS